MTTAFKVERRGRKRSEVQPKVHDRRSSDLPINSMVAVAIVKDPYDPNGGRITTFRSIRDDILAEMFAKEEIDQAQYDAGRKYERYAERAEIGNVKAIDPGKEAVDGGMGYGGITDEQIDAVRCLSEAARVLGAKGEGVVRTILIDRRRFTHLGMSDRATAAMRVKFFTYLEILAEFWGCTTKKVVPIPRTPIDSTGETL